MNAQVQLENALKRMGTDPNQGLTAAQVLRSREIHGRNEPPPVPGPPLWRLYLEKSEDPAILVLLICIGLALATGTYRGLAAADWGLALEALAVFVAVLLIVTASLWTEEKANRAINSAKAGLTLVKVIRDGVRGTISLTDLVIGDLVCLERGDIIPTDGLVLVGGNLLVDQSVITGESELVRKNGEHDPALILGTDVIDGSASMVVTSVREDSDRIWIREWPWDCWENERTPLEHKLGDLADALFVTGTLIVTVVFVILWGTAITYGELGGTLQPAGGRVLWCATAMVLLAIVIASFLGKERTHHMLARLAGWGIILVAGMIVVGMIVLLVWGTPLSGEGSTLDNFLDNVLQPLLRLLMVVLALLVAVVPEELPMAMMISFASRIHEVSQKILVRKTVAIEALAATTVLCLSSLDVAHDRASATVRRFREAGIEVKMVAFTSKGEAEAIARQASLLEKDSLTIVGEQFAAMSDQEVLESLPRLRLLARSHKLDKLRLVRLLQSQGEVVAVTGDSLSDVVVVRNADVGIAMGIRGADLVKANSNIVLVDDSLESILLGIHWGRTLYENLLEYLQFLLSVSLSTLAIALFSPILALLVQWQILAFLPQAHFLSLPFTVVSLLWIGLIVGPLAILVFSAEPWRDGALQVPPRPRDAPLITRGMLINVLFSGLLSVLVVFSLQATGCFLGVDPGDPARVRAVLLAVYVSLQATCLFDARSLGPSRLALTDVLRNRNLFTVLGVIVAVQILMTQLGGAVLNLAPLSASVWIKILAIGICAMLFKEFVRFVWWRCHARLATSGGAGIPGVHSTSRTER